MRAWKIALIVLSAWPSASSWSAADRASPPYVLSPEELAPLRALKGEASPGGYAPIEARETLRNYAPLERVIAHIADKRGGKYSGNNWSVLQTYKKFFGYAPPAINVVRDRYVVGRGCRHPYCDEKATYIIDLETGHVAFALLHFFTADKQDLGDAGAVTQFMKTCTDAGFRTVAGSYFLAWGRAAMVRPDDLTGRPRTLNEAAGKTLTTRC